ncbi:hypothetical protein ACTXJJ_06415 [Corynebacterium casei]|uniref:hypothetical protein n=1 Tax=Corynebacterium casei TaxID=160386 RepID=UPI003FD40F88
MRRLAAATTAVLTAVALAACSGEDDSSPEPSAVRAPASTTATTTTTEATTEAATEAAPDDRLPTIAEYAATLAYAADLGGAAITKRPDGAEREGTAYAETTPGQTLRMTKPDGERAACSLGAVADFDGEAVLITAGHCGPVSTEYSEVVPSSGAESRIGQAVVSTNPGQENRGTTTTMDASIVSTAAKTGGFDPRIGGHYAVTGVADPSTITTRDEICKYSAKTGETCGKALAATDSYLRAGTYSVKGDSGSPAYIKTGENTVLLVGFLSSSPTEANNVADFALAYPIYTKYGLDLPDEATSAPRGSAPQPADPATSLSSAAPFDAASEAPAPPTGVTLGAGYKWQLTGPFATVSTCDQNADRQPALTSECFSLSDGGVYFWNAVQAG